MMDIKNKLQTGIFANNYQIIELYNKMRDGMLDASPDFQRKLVWKKQHKIKFIETILLNFPFPEIYIAPGELDISSLKRQELIVDGQQRLNAIVNYIEGTDVFALSNKGIPKFQDLSQAEKTQFLTYEVSVRNLKDVSIEQIKEIFQRINSTDYALNKTERLNAQWGESEFICFSKQIIDDDLDLNMDLINYRIDPKNRESFLNFFHTKYRIFNEGDTSRMLSLQYMLTLIATLCEQKYFRRNDATQKYIQDYNDEFRDASEIEIGLLRVLQFLDNLNLSIKSYWFNKANIFTLIIELYKYDVNSINQDTFKAKLLEIEAIYQKYNNGDTSGISIELMKYFEVSREGVNEKPAREHRGNIINKLIKESL